MESGNKKHGYIYLIREREFLLRNEHVYKHGKTCLSEANLALPRLNKYKKGSELLFIRQVPCHTVHIIESNITQRFKTVFEKHNDGYEYFIGDPFVMINEINNIVNSHSQMVAVENNVVSTYEEYLANSDIHKIIITVEASSGFV